jgi:hypothetical protein
VEELVVNLHIHSVYSDGNWTHQRIAEAGIQAGLDAMIITDHNILIHDLEGYFKNNGKKILVVIGEEIHNKLREPQKSHLITFGQTKELCTYADNVQQLINHVKKSGGLSFLAHPFEDPLPQVNETAITWEDWEAEGFTGIEIWNHLSELKNVSKNWFQLLFNVFFPQFYSRGPHPDSIRRWDELLLAGKKLVAVGGSDAHCLNMKKGLFKRKIFPYQFHFKSLNNHIFVQNAPTGNYLMDRKAIIDAFRNGTSFVGNDLPFSTKGFRFYAQGRQKSAIMGEEIEIESSITLQIKLPEAVECHLIHNGKTIQVWNDQEICTYITKSTGFYRVECYIQYLGLRRGWIFSNPIHIVKKQNQS